jgi:hypothetical protein
MGLLNSEPAGRPTAPQVRALLTQATHAIPTTGPTAQVWSLPNPTHPGAGRPRNRRTMAIVLAVVLAVVMGTAGWFGHSLFASTSDSGASGTIQKTMTYGEGGQLPVFEISFYATHSCMAQLPVDQRQYKNADQVDCVKKEHVAEIYDEIRTDFKGPDKSKGTAGAAYPGDYLAKFADSACSLTFNSDQVKKPGKEMNYVAIIPSQQAWNDPDGAQRSISCVAWTKDGSTVTGSILPSTDN